jgi:hypothetical protein
LGVGKDKAGGCGCLSAAARSVILKRYNCGVTLVSGLVMAGTDALWSTSVWRCNESNWRKRLKL